MSRIALLAIALVTASPVFANPENSANPDERTEMQFAAACRPGLKYADGACVRACPAGHDDHGRWCEYRNSAGGGGGSGGGGE